MRICQISKSDSAGGGASRVAEELTTLFAERGHETTHFVSWSRSGFGPSRRSIFGLARRPLIGVRRAIRLAGLPDYVPLELPFLLARPEIAACDVIHFHDLSSAISPWTLIALAREKPVLWTLHDCSAFTGGCLYPMGCERYRDRCGSCPQLGAWPMQTPIDLTPVIRDAKARVHASRVRCLAPSQWMADLAFGSGMLPRRPKVVPNGVDTALFRPRDVAVVRAELGIPSERPVIMLVAGHLGDERKGTAHALRALRAIHDLRPFVVVVGTVDAPLERALAGIDCLVPGYLDDTELLARYYAAADVLLFCSTADNQPLTILEALACGTPVVGFATGGVPELIPNDTCGLLVPPRDDVALEAALRSTFDLSGETHDRRRRWRTEARARALAHFARDTQYENHLAVYREAIAERRER